MAETNGNGVHPTKDKTVDLTNGDVAVDLAVAAGPKDEEGEFHSGAILPRASSVVLS